MTIRKRLARSNIMMFVVPVLVAAGLLFIGTLMVLILMKQCYLPQLGISLWEVHQTGEQVEELLAESAILFGVYAGVVIVVLVSTIALTNIYLTRNLFRHISAPLDIVTAGVARIRDGNLDTPIAYQGADEFREVCDAVDEMAARLKASLEQQQCERQRKQELIAGMSHDLKSPLTSIRAYTEALLDGVAKDKETEQRYLQTIHSKELDIENMVNHLFTFAKMDVSAYPAQQKAVPLRQTIQALLEEEDTEGMEITLEIASKLHVMADCELLHRILLNLLQNSRKYSGRETVHICICAMETNKMGKVLFVDDGVGVSQEQLPKLFDAFYRGDASRTAPGQGSGLGLAVVKKAVEAMQGTVWAENSTSGGLCIAFTLPLAKEVSYVENFNSRG